MIRFGTKAETLQRISRYSSTFIVPTFEYCTYENWQHNSVSVSTDLASKFSGKLLAVRSSALIEDSTNASMAGAFESILNVPAEAKDIEKAISDVFSSYGKNIVKGDQVIIQEMVHNVAISGVAMTHNLQDGAPYYTISYDDFSGRTDTITSGLHPHKTIIVHRFCPDVMIKSPRIRAVLRLIRDIESVMGTRPMDIEFAVDDNFTPYLLQVRPITTDQSWTRNIDLFVNTAIQTAGTHLQKLDVPAFGLYGQRTVYANMPDWNPAEIIQDVPHPLAASLYRHLITRQVWADARTEMGYHAVQGVDLMKLVAGHAYIDVRASLNSLLPADLDQDVGERFINTSIDRLINEPAFHDKLEFELAITVHTPDFDEDFDRIFPEISTQAREQFECKLKELTGSLVSLQKDSSLVTAEQDIRKLEQIQSNRSLQTDEISFDESIEDMLSVLSVECMQFGTKPFAILARHGFIAQSFLKSIVNRGILSSDRCEDLKSSIDTIASDLSDMMRDVSNGVRTVDAFMSSFGHVRPGSYDITSPRYADRQGLFTSSNSGASEKKHKSDFTFNAQETEDIEQALRQSGIQDLTAEEFYQYLSRSIAGREWGKLIFTRHLSDMLELITKWGEARNISRADLSFLDVGWLLDSGFSSGIGNKDSVIEKMLLKNREEWDVSASVCMPHALFSDNDLYVIPLHRSMPNFVTRLETEAEVVTLDNASMGGEEIDNKIVCIRSADPGFDWIFSRNIAGLITQHGGPNSHMAIRCTEFELPAAIGVGEELFARLSKAEKVSIDCAKKNIEVRH